MSVQTKDSQSLILFLCLLFLSLRWRKEGEGFMQTHGIGEISWFSSTFGLQNHSLLILAGLCLGVFSQVCAYVIYDLVSFFGFGQSPCLQLPLTNSSHLGSAGHGLPQPWQSNNSLLQCLWWTAPQSTCGYVQSCLEHTGIKDGWGKPTLVLPLSLSSCGQFQPAR